MMVTKWCSNSRAPFVFPHGPWHSTVSKSSLFPHSFVRMDICLSVYFSVHSSVYCLSSTNRNSWTLGFSIICNTFFYLIVWVLKFTQIWPEGTFQAVSYISGMCPNHFFFLESFLTFLRRYPWLTLCPLCSPWLSYFFKEAWFFLGPFVFASSVQMSSERGKWTLHAITKIVLTS